MEQLKPIELGQVEYNGSSDCIKCKIMMTPLEVLWSESFEPEGLCPTCRDKFMRKNMKDRLSF
jgi:hypothetical protein